MYEASKTNRIRGEEFKRRYFAGDVLDIGCGPDPVVPYAVPFDTPQGDAQRILDYLEPESFDCVHSSHCLEHMRDVPGALRQWWALVRPRGTLIIVVPDEDLYEQGVWPSVFNTDHKATFRLGKNESWSRVSYDIASLVGALPDAEIIDARRQDENYDRRLMRIGSTGPWLARFGKRRHEVFRALMREGLPIYRLDLLCDRVERRLGKPIDQTLGAAMAQIQVIARKGDKARVS